MLWQRNNALKMGGKERGKEKQNKPIGYCIDDRWKLKNRSKN